jgi:glutamate-1-semialdehyde 2,1-aminomutase
MGSVDRRRLEEALHRERHRFVLLHPRSAALSEDAQLNLLTGVPMAWMTRWAGPFPLFFSRAEGGRIIDADGLEYVDFALGDTGAMTGHARQFVTESVQIQASRGITTMLPSEDAIWVGAELERRFGLPLWQFALTATDANRFALRIARYLTGRPKILVFDWCYHGTVDETLVTVDNAGNTRRRDSNIGAPIDPALTTKVVQFNDLAGLEAALAPRDVACVLAEPALTNIGIVLPEPGFHEALRSLTRETGTLLIIDETHTICTGPGGATAAWGLQPDMLTIGKPIGGGVPTAAYGLSHDLADRLETFFRSEGVDVSGIGGTLAGNALAAAAMRATLQNALREEDYAVAVPLAEQWTAAVASVIAQRNLPWTVQRLGCRAEYWFCSPPRNGREAAAAVDATLEAWFHLFMMNRGVLLTPFHNMALMCSSHTPADVDLHTRLFADAVDEIVTTG